MGYSLSINGVYWGYSPLTNHLLTSWDIQAPNYLLAKQLFRVHVRNKAHDGYKTQQTRVGNSHHELQSEYIRIRYILYIECGNNK